MLDSSGPMGKLIGQMLGQYRIVEPLGRGGMATVFKALQPSLGRHVAVKVLPPYYAHEPGFAQRFTREARAVAQLEHPHILPVYDFGQQGDYSYIVLKYVPAGTLKDRIDAGPLALAQATDIVCQIAEALDYAHQRGIIHRDVKPSNVLMDQGRWCLLTDFGLARMVEGSTQLTASGVGVGTPDYMAPEQGQGRTVDRRADIYSLGVVLFEMLTGQVPYNAETPMAVVLKHITDPLPMPRSLDPTIPESVEGVILKALAKEPDDRYAAAGEMAAALRDALRATALGVPAQADAWPETAPMPPQETLELEEAAPPLPAPPILEGTRGSVSEALAPEASVAAAPETVKLPSRRRTPWWAFALGALSLLAIAGVILVATGVLGFSPPDTPEADAPEAGIAVLTPGTRQQPIPPGSLIVDNADPAFSIEAGDWGTCENGDCEGVSYAADFRYAEVGCTTCLARFDLRITTAGEYDLWTWWPQGEDRATDTPFTVQHGEKSLTIHVDQRRGGSNWVRLATLAFNEGDAVSVLVNGSSTGYANADAVALTRAGAWRPGTITQRDPTVGIVVDNLDPGFSIEAGDWGTSEDDDAYGVDFLYAPPDCASCRARFDVTITDAGEYDLWAWWPRGDDRATDTPFTIRYGDGSLTAHVDQRHNGTAWHRLATLALEPGESVRIIVEGTDTGYANADAIAFTPAGTWTPP
jgi:serine/threonine protein kinase